MRRALTLIATFAFVGGLATVSDAAPCKDAKGKFVKCPTVAARCRDKTTKAFAKCGAPNTEPVPVAAKPPPKK